MPRTTFQKAVAPARLVPGRRTFSTSCSWSPRDVTRMGRLFLPAPLAQGRRLWHHDIFRRFNDGQSARIRRLYPHLSGSLSWESDRTLSEAREWGLRDRSQGVSMERCCRHGRNPEPRRRRLRRKMEGERVVSRHVYGTVLGRGDQTRKARATETCGSAKAPCGCSFGMRPSCTGCLASTCRRQSCGRDVSSA